MLVDDTNEHGLVLVRKAADGRNLRNTVLQALHERFGQLVRLIGDDLELDGFLEALEHAVADMAGNKAVDKAEDDRLDLEIINKIRDSRNDRVDAENDPDEVVFRIFVMNERGDKVSTAGAAADAHNAAVAEAAYNARRHRCENLAGAVGRLVEETVERNLI